MSWNNIIPFSILEALEAHNYTELDVPNFTIEEEYLTGIPVKYGWNTHGIPCSTMSSVDHPSFDALRKRLSGTGFIKIPEYPCWNGDRVIKTFSLNNVVFNVGETFLCASAMKGRLK